jgi:hypothetical protein
MNKTINKYMILLCFSMLSHITACHKKGDITDHKIEIIINDVHHHLYSFSDGQYKLRVLVPVCENCKIPFAITYVTDENRQFIISTIKSEKK